MGTHASSMKLGDLVVAAFDEAARYSLSPRERSRLATQTIAHLMLRKGRMVLERLADVAWRGERGGRAAW